MNNQVQTVNKEDEDNFLFKQGDVIRVRFYSSLEKYQRNLDQFLEFKKFSWVSGNDYRVGQEITYKELKGALHRYSAGITLLAA